MNKNDAKLFGEAIAEGVLNKFERELAGNTESAGCSEAHEAAMLEIIATSKAIEQRIGRKKFVAILVAAALLLLVGCTAYVYGNQIGSFIETFLEDGVNIGFADKGENKITTIEEVYELTYVPDEYVLTQKLINDIGVVYTYTDENQNSICFDQYPLGISSSIGIDNDTNNASALEHNGIEIYVRVNANTRHYVWKDDKYLMTLVCPTMISEEEALKIVDGLSG